MANVKNISDSVTPTSIKVVNQSHKMAAIPDYIKDEAKKELKMVKGRFRLYEKGREGGSEKVTFRKYPEEICPMFQKVMKDGEVYEIPLYAARFINGFDSNAKAINGRINSLGIAKHAYKMNHSDDLRPSDPNNPVEVVPMPYSTEYERRMGFESLEFAEGIA